MWPHPDQSVSPIVPKKSVQAGEAHGWSRLWGGARRVPLRLIQGAQPYPDDEVMAAKFRARQLQMVARQGIFSLPTQLASGVALVWMMWPAQQVFLSVWLSLIMLVSVLAAGRMRRNMSLEHATLSNFRTGTWVIAAAAILWALFPMVTLTHATEQEELTILLAMTCLTSAGAVVFQNMPVAGMAWVGVLVGGTTIAMWVAGVSYIHEITVVALLYAVILIRHILFISGDSFARMYAVHRAQDLSTSLAQQAQIAQATSSWVLLLNRQGLVTWANEAFLQRVGVELSAVIGRSPAEWLLFNEGSTAWQRCWRDLVRSGQATTEVPVHIKEGDRPWMRLDIKRVFLQGYSKRSYVIVAADVSDLKTKTATLRSEQDRLQHIIDGTHCGTWEIDADGGVCKMGGHWLDIIGVDTRVPMVVEGAFLMDRIHPDDRPSQQEAFVNYLRGTANHYVHEHRIRHEDGSWRWVSARGKASAFGADGRIEQMSGISVDISKDKLTELALIEATRLAKQANRAKSMFLATMSHEIRTPMNGVIGTAEWLKLTDLSAEQRDGIQTIVDSGRALLTIIDDILDFTKVESGRMKLEEVAMSLRDLAEGVIDALMPVAATKHVDLHLFIDPRLPQQVMGDPNRLRQVVFNLVGNAIKFGAGTDQQHGQVDVQIQAADDGSQSWQLLVSDDGIGMSTATLARLFTPFTQAEASTTRRFGGTGLGLAICHRLVDLMGGGIEAHSVPGHGATFMVTLPMQMPGDSFELAAKTHDLQGVECFLISGRNYRSDSFYAYLEHAGAQVQVCRNLQEVILQAGHDLLPVVIQDVPESESSHHDELQLAKVHERFRFLWVDRYAHGPVRIIGPNVGRLGRAHVDDVLTAVAVLAGLKSPELAHNALDEFDVLCAEIRRDGARIQADGRLILVAEDDRTNQQVIRRQLHMLGYACEIANDGSEALTMWRSGRFDILLSDLHMPELDGYELAQCIRSDEQTMELPRAPIVALTANALMSEETRALEAGMDEYLTKPISPKDLHQCLRRWLPQSEDELGKDMLSGKPSTVSATTPSPLDVDVLRALVGDDPGVIAELLGDFQLTSSVQGARIKQALDEADQDEIRRLSHQLKSSARSVGARRLGDLCADVELSIKSNVFEVNLVSRLLDELQCVQTCLNEFKEGVES